MSNQKNSQWKYQKGAVGKTATTFTPAACVIEQPSEMLVIDLDPQANLATSIGLSLACSPSYLRSFK